MTDEFRLKCHAAYRASTRANLSDLGVHGTGVDRAREQGTSVGGALIQLRGGVRYKLCAAPVRAKIIRMSLVLGSVLGDMRINIHAADRTIDQSRIADLSTMAIGLFAVRAARAVRAVSVFGNRFTAPCCKFVEDSS